MEKKMKKKLQPVDIIVFILLTLLSSVLILLLAWGLLTSLKSYDDFAYMGNVIGLPDLSVYGAKTALAFGNYRRILFSTVFQFSATDASYYSSIFGYVSNAPEKTFKFVDFLLNSFIYSIVCSFVHAFVAFACAYLCAKYKFRFSEFVYVLMLVVMAIPIVGSSPAMIELLRDLAIYDTFFAMIALNFNFTGVYFFVFYAHLSGISNTYMEAAEIDGASQLGTFMRIIFPICAKVFFTVFLLQFIQTWNDYQTPLIYIPSYPTLAYGLWHYINVDSTGSVPMKLSGCMVMAVPLFVLFIAFQNKLMGNVSVGGLK